ncbi:hypothetical protein ViNHUV68_30400 [Vibrio sp. NH-UV-68]
MWHMPLKCCQKCIRLKIKHCVCLLCAIKKTKINRVVLTDADSFYLGLVRDG